MTPFSSKPGLAGGVLGRRVSAVIKPLLARSQLLRFLIVGVGNTIVGYLFFLAALRLVAAPVLALAIATVAGVLFNFMTNGRFVFGSTDPRRLWRFGLAYSVTFVFNALLLRTLCQLGLKPQIAGLIGVVPGAALSFVLSRTFVFADRR
jgi:putative flippase GtrA